ncbi:unnamed protein product [Meloidogyne enterolobii]|uniref:Uncharacterized protein n=1 Tax=Meloidogyne enterolobii TaxID=390850 RepID=A0ACB0YJG9_MELEN
MTTPINIYIILFSSFLIFHSINGCIPVGQQCNSNDDCCPIKGIDVTCHGSWTPTKQKGKCKKSCDDKGAACDPDVWSNCCNGCDIDHKKCK